MEDDPLLGLSDGEIQLLEPHPDVFPPLSKWGQSETVRKSTGQHVACPPRERLVHRRWQRAVQLDGEGQQLSYEFACHSVRR